MVKPRANCRPKDALGVLLEENRSLRRQAVDLLLSIESMRRPIASANEPLSLPKSMDIRMTRGVAVVH